MPKPFVINVGGTKFTTTMQTLSLCEYFRSLFNRWNSDAIRNLDVNVTNEEFFIDRDPEGFSHVLRYLRDKNYKFPRQFAYELEFYGINGAHIDDGYESYKHIIYAIQENTEVFQKISERLNKIF